MIAVVDKLSFNSKEERPWQNSLLAHGCIVGHTTTSTTKIWIHVHEPGTYTLILNTQPLADSFNHDKEWRNQNNEVFVPDISLDLIVDSSSQHCGVFEVGLDKKSKKSLNAALTADTQYYYGVRFNNNWILGIENNNNFRTLAENGDLTFGFYSCHMPFKKLGFFEGIGVASTIENWSHLREVLDRQSADFVIGAGDQVYTDGDPKISIWAFLKKNKDEVLTLSDEQQRHVMLSWYADIYHGYWGFTSVRNVFANYPNYMTWDDHEILDGWGSYEQDSLENILKVSRTTDDVDKSNNRDLMYKMYNAASSSYYNFQHSHNPNTGITNEIVADASTIADRKWHYDFNAKGSAFFFMDTRGHKSMDTGDPNYEGKITLLGKDQVDDFKEWLKKEDTKNAKVLFIVSAVPIMHWRQYVIDISELTNFADNRDDVRDGWSHDLNVEERDDILDVIFKFSEQNSNKKVFFLSGDVHCAANFKLTKQDSDARVYQLTSSAITYAKKFPSWLVKIYVADTGKLYKRDDILFERLTDVETRNNFASISVTGEGDDVSVNFDLYGRAEQESGLLMFNRLKM